MSNFVVTLTNRGRELEAQQLLYGYGFKIEFFVLGSGGHDPSNPTQAKPIDPSVVVLPGVIFPPSGYEPIDKAELINPTCPQFTCVAQAGEAVGPISNLGLIATMTYVPGAFFSVLPDAIDISLDTITKSSHGLLNDDDITLSSTGVPPGGITPMTTYYVRDRTVDTFRLAATLGGPAIDITSQGLGTHAITYGSIPGAPLAGTQFLYALTNFPLRYKLSASQETFTITIKT